MTRTLARSASIRIRRTKHSAADVRRFATPRRPLQPSAMSARRAWAAALHVREAMQNRIVRAFGQQADGTGAGPSEMDLRLFARFAVMEQRLKRSLGRARVQWPCERESLEQADALRQGESP